MIVQMCMRKSELDRVFRRKSDVPWNSAMQVAMCDLLNHMGAVVGMSNIAEDAEAMTWSVLRGHVAEIFSKNELDIFRTYAESKAPIIKAIRKNMGVEGLSPELVADAIVEYWSGCPFVVADFDNFFSNVGIEALSAITQGFVDRKYALLVSLSTTTGRGLTRRRNSWSGSWAQSTSEICGASTTTTTRAWLILMETWLCGR